MAQVLKAFLSLLSFKVRPGNRKVFISKNAGLNGRKEAQRYLVEHSFGKRIDFVQTLTQSIGFVKGVLIYCLLVVLLLFVFILFLDVRHRLQQVKDYSH